MNELSPLQVKILERFISEGFTPVAFPLYANVIGIRKGSFAALLDPIPGNGFRVFGEPCLLLEGNLTVRVKDQDKSWFVWKKLRVEATPERLSELENFIREATILLEPRL